MKSIIDLIEYLWKPFWGSITIISDIFKIFVLEYKKWRKIPTNSPYKFRGDTIESEYNRKIESITNTICSKGELFCKMLFISFLFFFIYQIVASIGLVKIIEIFYKK